MKGQSFDFPCVIFLLFVSMHMLSGCNTQEPPSSIEIRDICSWSMLDSLEAFEPLSSFYFFPESITKATGAQLRESNIFPTSSLALIETEINTTFNDQLLLTPADMNENFGTSFKKSFPSVQQDQLLTYLYFSENDSLYQLESVEELINFMEIPDSCGQNVLQELQRIIRLDSTDIPTLVKPLLGLAVRQTMLNGEIIDPKKKNFSYSFSVPVGFGIKHIF